MSQKKSYMTDLNPNQYEIFKSFLDLLISIGVLFRALVKLLLYLPLC